MWDYIMKKAVFEQIGGTYHQESDYLLSDLTPPDSILIGVWDQRRRHYLKAHQESIYTALLFSDELDSHLSEIDR